MHTPFFKMHGLGNDFVIIDERARTPDAPALTATRIAALADRRRGIGCDQFVTLNAPRDAQADVFVRFFNPDGSEAGACGNASRCVAALIAPETTDGTPVLETKAGLLHTKMGEDRLVTVDMGQPRTGWQDVPLAQEVDTLRLPLPGAPAAVSMGNPHATFFVDDLAAAEAGPALEHDLLFPERANIGFARIDAADLIRLRVWERGAGFTLACGSGACAAVVNAARRGLVERHCRVEMDGGMLEIEWGEDDHVRMTGPVATAFTGSVVLGDYPE